MFFKKKNLFVIIIIINFIQTPVLKNKIMYIYIYFFIIIF